MSKHFLHRGVRRFIKENMVLKKLYSEGLSIRTPLDVSYQTQSLKSFETRIESYDRRHGWRGPITNKLKDRNWKKK